MPALSAYTTSPAAHRAPSSGQGLKSQSDEELLVGLRQSSEAHFTELYERYFNRVYAFSYSRVRNHADAEEIAQEAFLAVFRSVDAFRGQSSLLSWIYGIAKNTANNHLRRQKVREERIDTAEFDLVASTMSVDGADPGDQLDMRLYTEALETRLASLTEWQLEIFCMRHLENLSISEICDRTQRSGDAVRSSLYRVKRIFFETAEGEHAQ